MALLFTPLTNVLPVRSGAMRNAHQAVTPRVRYTSAGLLSNLSLLFFLCHGIGGQIVGFFLICYTLLHSKSASLTMFFFAGVFCLSLCGVFGVTGRHCSRWVVTTLFNRRRPDQRAFFHLRENFWSAKITCQSANSPGTHLLCVSAAQTELMFASGQTPH